MHSLYYSLREYATLYTSTYVTPSHLKTRSLSHSLPLISSHSPTPTDLCLAITSLVGLGGLVLNSLEHEKNLAVIKSDK